MNLELDMLFAIACLASVAFFVAMNVVAFRTRGYESAVKVVAHGTPDSGSHPRVTEAANDGEMREAA